MPGRHCTDQQLISFRDEALNPLLRVWVSWHLNSCWKCFSRMRDLGQLEEDLATSWRMSGPVPGMNAEGARAEFAAWAASSGIEFNSKPAQRWRPNGYMKAALASCLGAVALIGGATVWRMERAEPQTPPSIVRSSTPSRIVAATPPVTVTGRHPVVEPLPAPAQTAKLEAPPVVEHPGPSDEQLIQTELEVWWILHRAGACRGEPIEAGISGRKVKVTGIAPSNARQKHLIKLLSESSGHEWLRIEIASTEARLSKARAIPVEESMSETQTHAMPLTDHAAVSRAAVAALRVAHPAEDDDRARQRLVQITRNSVHSVEEAITEAWAIRRLQERFAGVRLAPQSRLIVEAMLREHLLALQADVSALGRTLNPILSHMTLISPDDSSPETLFASVDRVRTLVEAAFAGDAEPLGTPAKIGGEIVHLCDWLSDELSNLDDLAGRIFPANP